jgi:putative spermidine/putrescine transport system substrate-binding protein
MDRRIFLAVAMGMPVAAIAASCQSSTPAALRIAPLQGSLPLQLIKVFERQVATTTQISVTPKDSLVKIYGALQGWQTDITQPPEARSAASYPPADWVTLTDYWLAAAIQQALIQPVDVSTVEGWSQLDRRWQQLVQRNQQGFVEESAPVWGIPYRWGNLAILYDKTRLTPLSLSTWADLLHPALKQRLVLPDHPRLVIGLALKALGASANVENPLATEGLSDFLADLQPQVRFYSSDYYLEPLIIGDALAVVGWDIDMLPLLAQYRHLAAVIPAAGTLLSADLWVQPTAITAASPLTQPWLEFCLSEDFAEQLAIYDLGQSPRLWNLATDEWPEPLRRTGLQPTPETLNQSEFLYPLAPAATAQYQKLWETLRPNG